MSNKQEHTKGEWKLNNYHYPHSFIVVRTSSADNDSQPCSRKICDICSTGKVIQEWHANAHLIAAVPDLLEACKRDAELANQSILRTPSGPLRNKLTEINILRLKAIAKAEGETWIG